MNKGKSPPSFQPVQLDQIIVSNKASQLYSISLFPNSTNKQVNQYVHMHNPAIHWTKGAEKLDKPERTVSSTLSGLVVDAENNFNEYNGKNIVADISKKQPGNFIPRFYKIQHTNSLGVKRTNNEQKSVFSKKASSKKRYNEDSDSKKEQFISIGLNCPIDLCSSVTETKEQLDHHIISEHKVFPYQCFLRKCKQSFSSWPKFCDHVCDHLNVTEWQCFKCENHFKNIWSLYTHVFLNHYEGIFKCGKELCSFRATTRISVVSHYNTTHLKSNKEKTLNSNIARKSGSKLN